MKIYIVASNTEFTVVTLAENKKQAIENARAEFWNIHGFLPEESREFFTAYNARKYLADENLVFSFI